MSGISLESIFRGLLGLAFIIGVSYLLSSSRRNINWRLVGAGLIIQLIFAVLVLKVDFISNIFQVFADFFVLVLGFTKAGSEFLFGNLLKADENYGFIFALQVLPTIIFFSALSSLLYYLGILQKIVYGIAWLMNKSMKLSGAESLSAAANIFIGQTEAPLVVKPYIEKMTRSEIMALMTCGMATIAGGVMAAYIGYLGGDDIEQQKLFARHLLAASVLSAPAGLLCAKILVPETHEVNREMEISKESIGANMLESISNGTSEGVKLAINVAAMLLVFTALMAMLNYIFMWVGDLTGWNEQIREASAGRYNGLSLQYVLGYVFSPIAWLVGTRIEDLQLMGQLLGEKTILNEFYAYKTMGEMKHNEVLTDEKSIVIATYALCGFSNFASIGIQIGGIGSLAPGKRRELSELGIRALIGGTFACLMTAAIAGMLY